MGRGKHKSERRKEQLEAAEKNVDWLVTKLAQRYDLLTQREVLYLICDFALDASERFAAHNGAGKTGYPYGSGSPWGEIYDSVDRFAWGLVKGYKKLTWYDWVGLSVQILCVLSTELDERKEGLE